MGLSHLNPLSLLLILLIIVAVFGTTKLKNIGSDLGAALRNFRQGMEGSEQKKDNETTQNKQDQ